MSSEHTNDSPATWQRKTDWRATKFAEKIWKEHGFDTTMDETLINSLFNPTRRLLEDDYRPILTNSKPASDRYWDIPVTPNAKFFTVFEPFNLSLPEDQRLPLKFECLNQFHAKHGTVFEKSDRMTNHP